MPPNNNTAVSSSSSSSLATTTTPVGVVCCSSSSTTGCWNQQQQQQQDIVSTAVQKEDWFQQPLLILLLGASGDLVHKKIFPSLYQLYTHDLLPVDTQIVGSARRSLTTVQWRTQLSTHLQHCNNDDVFLSRCTYRQISSYGDASALQDIILHNKNNKNILVYLALPPSVFATAVGALGLQHHKLYDKNRFFVRVVLEKPFGHDTTSCRDLLSSLAGYAPESVYYRMDHYLGKAMVQNIVPLRTHNPWVAAVWNRHTVQSVHIVCKEMVDTAGRGGYFDGIGIVRDILQNHLLQILTLVAAKFPLNTTTTYTPQQIRDAKVQVLKNIRPIALSDVLHGQYEGYKNDPTIAHPETTTTPTYVMMRTFIDDPTDNTWRGVPFILEAGKALDERVCEVRMQLKNGSFVLRLQPQASIFLTTHMKTGGLASVPVETCLQSSAGGGEGILPYTRLLLDVMRGRQTHFVRSDELIAAWEIFTPLLDALEGMTPVSYEKGTSGPTARDDFLREMTKTRSSAEQQLPAANL